MKRGFIHVSAIILTLLFCLQLSAKVVQAGLTDPWAIDTRYSFSSPSSISYFVNSDLSEYSVDTYVNKWCQASNRLGFIRKPDVPSTSITITHSRNINNGTYGTTSFADRNHKTITFYALFFKSTTTTSQRNEVIVHEVGHALGLDHPHIYADQSKAVMRGEGFNNKAYPLYGDIRGIQSLYE